MKLFSGFKERSSVTQVQRNQFSWRKTQQIPPLPDVLEKEPALYEIIDGIVTASVIKNLYTVQEPALTDTEYAILEQIMRGLYEIVNLGPADNPAAYIEKCTRVIIAELHLRITEESFERIHYIISRNIIGLGRIEPLLQDSLITEIRYAGKKEPVEVTHRKYGKLKTDIVLKPEEIATILRKLLLSCEKELDAEEQYVECQLSECMIAVSSIPNEQERSQFVIKKKIIAYPTLLDLVRQKKVPAEVFAYLWMSMQDKRNIFIYKDTTMLNALGYFLPAGAKVLTNIPSYYPHPLTITYLGEIAGPEEYSLIDNLKNQPVRGTVIATVDMIDEWGKVVCYAEKGSFKSLRENGKEIFTRAGNKFQMHLKESGYIKTKGPGAMKELQRRAQLLTLLSRTKISENDTKKILAAYYENPGAVLKKAGIA